MSRLGGDARGIVQSYTDSNFSFWYVQRLIRENDYVSLCELFTHTGAKSRLESYVVENEMTMEGYIIGLLSYCGEHVNDAAIYFATTVYPKFVSERYSTHLDLRLRNFSFVAKATLDFYEDETFRSGTQLVRRKKFGTPAEKHAALIAIQQECLKFNRPKLDKFLSDLVAVAQIAMDTDLRKRFMSGPPLSSSATSSMNVSDDEAKGDVVPMTMEEVAPPVEQPRPVKKARLNRKGKVAMKDAAHPSGSSDSEDNIPLALLQNRKRTSRSRIKANGLSPRRSSREMSIASSSNGKDKASSPLFSSAPVFSHASFNSAIQVGFFVWCESPIDTLNASIAFLKQESFEEPLSDEEDGDFADVAEVSVIARIQKLLVMANKTYDKNDYVKALRMYISCLNYLRENKSAETEILYKRTLIDTAATLLAIRTPRFTVRTLSDKGYSRQQVVRIQNGSVGEDRLLKHGLLADRPLSAEDFTADVWRYIWSLVSELGSDVFMGFSVADPYERYYLDAIYILLPRLFDPRCTYEATITAESKADLCVIALNFAVHIFSSKYEDSYEVAAQLYLQALEYQVIHGFKLAFAKISEPDVSVINYSETVASFIDLYSQVVRRHLIYPATVGVEAAMIGMTSKFDQLIDQLIPTIQSLLGKFADIAARPELTSEICIHLLAAVYKLFQLFHSYGITQENVPFLPAAYIAILDRYKLFPSAMGNTELVELQHKRIQLWKPSYDEPISVVDDSAQSIGVQAGVRMQSVEIQTGPVQFSRREVAEKLCPRNPANFQNLYGIMRLFEAVDRRGVELSILTNSPIPPITPPSNT
jgi:hypothetical protein